MTRSFSRLAAVLLLIFLTGCAHTSGKRKVEPASNQPVRNYTPAISVKPVVVSPSDIGTYHTVMPKETVWRISKNYGVPIDVIMKANNIKDHNNLKIGQTLFIPGVGAGKDVMQMQIPLPGQYGRWQYIVVHHTATEEGNKDTIHELHLRRGWKNGLGYHFLIDNGTLGRNNGEIEVGHRWYRQMDGAHANKSNMNHIGIGISLVGNFSKHHVSEQQLKSLRYLVQTLMRHYRIPRSNVIEHKDVPGAATECPGNYFPWDEFKASL